MRFFTEPVSVDVNNSTVYTEAFRLDPDAQFIAAIIERTAGNVAVTVTLQGALSATADSEPASEQQSITIDAASGDFTLTFSGQTTDPITYDPDATTKTDILNALNALSNIDDGDVTVTGVDGGPWFVSFAGQYQGINVGQMTADDTNLVGGAGTATVATVVAGGSPTSDWVDTPLTSGAHNSAAPKQLTDGTNLHAFAAWPYYRFKVASAGAATVEGRVISA